MSTDATISTTDNGTQTATTSPQVGNDGQTQTTTAPPSPPPQPAPPVAPPVPQRYRASIQAGMSGNEELPDEFAAKVGELEVMLGRRVLMLLEGDGLSMYGSVVNKMVRAKSQIPREPIAVLLDSFGGQAQSAYRLATMLRRRCGNFIVIVPRFAVSAATLFSLGANLIVLGEDATLGPLDVQFPDHDVEEDWVSALDTVQAVEQLEDSAIEVAMKLLKTLKDRTKKKYSILLPDALEFAASITQPLFDKIDSVRYSRQSRTLKEAQDYAERLLRPRFSAQDAEAIARDLVRKYPTHDFRVDREEAKSIGVITDDDQAAGQDKRVVGLHVMPNVPQPIEDVLDWFFLNIHGIHAIGMLTPVTAPSTTPSTP